MLFSDAEPTPARLSGLCEIGIISDGLEEFHGHLSAVKPDLEVTSLTALVDLLPGLARR